MEFRASGFNNFGLWRSGFMAVGGSGLSVEGSGFGVSGPRSWGSSISERVFDNEKIVSCSSFCRIGIVPKPNHIDECRFEC